MEAIIISLHPQLKLFLIWEGLELNLLTALSPVLSRLVGGTVIACIFNKYREEQDTRVSFENSLLNITLMVQ